MKAILASGNQKIADMRRLITAVHMLDGSGQYERDDTERALVSNACFLSLFVALEEFLEAAFGHYLTGRMSTVRWRPSKYGRPPTVEHAHRMLIGTQRFVDWSTPDTVIKLADLYFDAGEPFRTPLVSVHSHLANMKTVRNSTAHVSRTTQAALDALYSKWTGVPSTGVGAYAMLMSIESGGVDTFYGRSEAIVSSILNQIANRV